MGVNLGHKLQDRFLATHTHWPSKAGKNHHHGILDGMSEAITHPLKVPEQEEEAALGKRAVGKTQHQFTV